MRHAPLFKRQSDARDTGGFLSVIVPELQISRTFSIMEMGKISGSIPFVNRNLEFW